jgi:serine/threonine protein phosphatase PrpC
LHAHRGEAREDALLLVQAGPLLIAAVADGAGSRPWSRIGSALACRAAVATLTAAATAPVDASALSAALGAALRAAEASLCDLAAAQAVEPRDLRTTLLVAVVAQSAAGTLIGAAQIGDGVIAVETSAGGVRPLVVGDTGEFAGEVSHFLPDDSAVDRAVQRIVVEPAAGASLLFLCSDGVDDCFYPLPTMGALLVDQLRRGVDAPLDGFAQRACDPVLSAHDPADALAEWLTFEKRGENDDRTMAVLWCDAR